MNAALKPAATLKAFLDWESRQEVRYEFDGFQPVARTGGTAARAAIQRNLIGLLYNRLRGHRFQAFGSELKIQAERAIRYPDAFIVCSPANSRVVLEPVIVFEILSENTSTTDRIDRTTNIGTCRPSSATRSLTKPRRQQPSSAATARIGLGTCRSATPFWIRRK